MATCGNCGAEGTRVRSRWEGANQLPDECPACAPQSFEKLSDPSDKKIWIGPEYDPNAYEKRYDVDGVYYVPKPEHTHELEQKMCGVNSVAAQEERAAIAEAEARKRATRRTKPLTQSELEQCLAVVDRYFKPLIEDQETAYDA